MGASDASDWPTTPSVQQLPSFFLPGIGVAERETARLFGSSCQLFFLTDSSEGDENLEGRGCVREGVIVSDCLHCEIHDMLESRLNEDGADLSEIAAKVTEVLADLITMAPPEQQTLMMASVVANLGTMVFEKSQQPSGGNQRH